MRLQQISMMNYNRVPRFTGSPKEDLNRPATLKDLYDMEDRIKKQNANLFAKQNRLIGDALDHAVRVAYLTTEDSDDVDNEFDMACNNIKILTENGKKPSYIKI